MDLDILLETEVLRDFEIVCRRNRGRNWFYPYMAAVFSLTLVLRERGLLKKAARKLAKKHQLRFCRGTDPIKILIDVSSKADFKTRSRWSRALRFAVGYRDEWGSRTSLAIIFMQNGGVAGCADKVATRRKKRVKNKGLRDWK